MQEHACIIDITNYLILDEARTPERGPELSKAEQPMASKEPTQKDEAQPVRGNGETTV